MLTVPALRGLLADLLTGAAGGNREVWLEHIGTVEVLSIALSPRSDWRISPRGTAKQIEAIATAAALERGEHPYVS